MEDVPFSTQKNHYVFSRHFDSIFYCHPEIVRLMRNKNREQNHNPGKSGEKLCKDNILREYGCGLGIMRYQGK